MLPLVTLDLGRLGSFCAAVKLTVICTSPVCAQLMAHMPGVWDGSFLVSCASFVIARGRERDDCISKSTSPFLSDVPCISWRPTILCSFQTAVMASNCIDKVAGMAKILMAAQAGKGGQT